MSSYTISNRIFSGIRKNALKGLHQVFFHLTTADNVEVDINDSFEVLKKRIIRKYGDFEYSKIRSNEGNNVLHGVATLPYVSQRWLSQQWLEIHKSPVVWVSEVKDAWAVASYMVSHYLGSQKCSYVRYSSSSDWIQKGYTEVYRFLKGHFRRWSDAYKDDRGNWCYPIDWSAVNHHWGVYIEQLANEDPPSNEDFILFVRGGGNGSVSSIAHGRMSNLSEFGAVIDSAYWNGTRWCKD